MQSSFVVGRAPKENPEHSMCLKFVLAMCLALVQFRCLSRRVWKNVEADRVKHKVED